MFDGENLTTVGGTLEWTGMAGLFSVSPSGQLVRNWSIASYPGAVSSGLVGVAMWHGDFIVVGYITRTMYGLPRQRPWVMRLHLPI